MSFYGWNRCFKGFFVVLCISQGGSRSVLMVREHEPSKCQREILGSCHLQWWIGSKRWYSWTCLGSCRQCLVLCEIGKTKSPQTRQLKIELQLSSKSIASTVKAKGFEMMKFLSSLSSIFCLSHLLLSCLSQGAVPAACAAQLPTEGLQPREWPVLGQGEGRGSRSSPEGLWDQPQPHPQGGGSAFSSYFPLESLGLPSLANQFIHSGCFTVFFVT